LDSPIHEELTALLAYWEEVPNQKPENGVTNFFREKNPGSQEYRHVD
jgi:hypothetical protein